MTRHLKRKAISSVILILIGVLAGPFGTYLELSVWGRLEYWSAAVLSVGLFMNAAMYLALADRPTGDRQILLRLAAGALLGALPSTGAIVFLEATLRQAPIGPEIALTVFGAVAPIGFLVALSELPTFREMVGPDEAGPGETEILAAQPDIDSPLPALFRRNLSADHSGRLISLSIRDHYLEVVSEGAREEILKRMADAVAELDGYPGLRIHRSHWVALDAVDRLDRDGRKMDVVLIDGRRLPVSRTNAAELIAAIDT